MISPQAYHATASIRTLPLMRRVLVAILSVTVAILPLQTKLAHAEEVLPKHVTEKTLKSVRSGLDYLARTQSDDGAWREGQGGQSYPMAMSALACTALLANGCSPTR